MKTAASIALIGSLLLVGGADARLCQFGYADAVNVRNGAPTLGWVGARDAGVPQDSGRIIPLDDGAVEAHTRDIRSYIQAMNANGIRPLVDLTDVLFNPDQLINPNCGADYERGAERNSWPLGRQEFKPDVEAKLDSFLALNSSELGRDSIRGFIVHVEANNNCVPAWRINAAARMLKDRGYGPAQGYALAAGYGFDNTPQETPSTGMPTGLFPFELTHITPWAYDIYSLYVDSVYNLNSDVTQLGAAGFWNKLVGKLSPNQQVIWGFPALCGPLQERMFNGLGTQCTTPPFQNTWPLASLAEQWRSFAEQQPRMEGLIAILWTEEFGTNALDSSVTSAHIGIGNSALTCDPTGTGLKGEYFTNAQLGGSPALVRTDATIDYDWAVGSPNPTLPSDWFSVRWTGQVQAQYTQTYTFYTRTDDGVRLWVNGQLLIDKWVGQSSTEWSGSINLTAGQLYNIKMEYFDGPGSAEARLLWSSPSTPKQVIPAFALYYPGVPPGASGTGLAGEYFNNAQLSGSPALGRIDATVNYDWAGGSPHPSLPSDWFSVRWTGLVQAQHTQTYTFYTRTDDGVRLWVNGQLLIDKWVGQSSTEWSGSINLTDGLLYNIKMEYFDGPGSAEARLLWSSPSTPKQVIPQVALVNVIPPAPVAAFSSVCTGLSCSFNSAGSTGTSLTYAWTFGDSTNGTGSTASHLYGGTGAYTATLTVSDPWGQQSSKSKMVSVTDEIPGAAENFFTVPPCRIADTRTTTPLTSGVQQVFQVTGLCGIPASAKAVSFNITVVSPTGPGHLVFFPGNQTSGPFAHATITLEPAISLRTNNAILRLATNGAGSVNISPYVAASPGQVHVILDVYGYFSEDTTPAPGAQGPLGFQTLTPCRIADTRTGAPIAPGTTRNFTVQGVCGVPAGAAAAPLNLIISSPTAGGHASFFQAGVPPGIPVITFNAGVVLTNGARIRLAPTTPDVSVNYYTPIAGAQSTHAVIDVFGYFKSDAPLKYRPITACRAVDTRSADQGGPALASPETRNFQIRGNCGVPLSAKAVAVNITSVGSTGGGYLVAYPSGGTLPLAAYLTFDPGQGAPGNGGIIALSAQPNDLTVTTSTSTHVIIDVFGYFQ